MEDVLLLHGFDYLSIYFFFSPQKIELSTSFHKRCQGCPQKVYDCCYKIKKRGLQETTIKPRFFTILQKLQCLSQGKIKQSFKIMISSPRESNLAPPKLFSVAQQFFMKNCPKMNILTKKIFNLSTRPNLPQSHTRNSSVCLPQSTKNDLKADPKLHSN